MRALHVEEKRHGHGEVEQAHDGRDLESIENADEDNARKDSAERGAGGFDEIRRAGGGARRKIAFPRSHARGGDKQRSGGRAKDAQANERSEQHRRGTDELAGNGLEESFGAAQCPDGCGKTCGQRDFERGDEPTRAAGLRVWRLSEDAGECAAEGGPEEPSCEQNAERDLVAVEDLDEFAHEHDLAGDGGEAAEGERRARGSLVRGIHCYGLEDDGERNARLRNTVDGEP